MDNGGKGGGNSRLDAISSGGGKDHKPTYYLESVECSGNTEREEDEPKSQPSLRRWSIRREKIKRFETLFREGHGVRASMLLTVQGHGGQCWCGREELERSGFRPPRAARSIYNRRPGVFPRLGISCAECSQAHIARACTLGTRAVSLSRPGGPDMSGSFLAQSECRTEYEAVPFKSHCYSLYALSDGSRT
jgi:hypothetical protein